MHAPTQRERDEQQLIHNLCDLPTYFPSIRLNLHPALISTHARTHVEMWTATHSKKVPTFVPPIRLNIHSTLITMLCSSCQRRITVTPPLLHRDVSQQLWGNFNVLLGELPRCGCLQEGLNLLPEQRPDADSIRFEGRAAPGAGDC